MDESQMPKEDLEQNWKWVVGWQDDYPDRSETVLSFSRLLNTEDYEEDVPIEVNMLNKGYCKLRDNLFHTHRTKI